MKSIVVKVDAELATEYCKKYRRLFPTADVKKLDDKSLLKAFLHDRLLEELDFVENELKVGAKVSSREKRPE